MSDPSWKSLLIVNIAMPVILAIAMVATTLHDGAVMLSFMATVIFALGLAIVNLVAPALLWKKHGVRAMVPLAALALAGTGSFIAWDIGHKAMLDRTPISKKFIHGSARPELESTGKRLLRSSNSESESKVLEKYRFNVEVDTSHRVVTFSYYRFRTCTRYYFAPEGLPGPHSSGPRITPSEIDWSGLRRIAKFAASGRTLGAHQFGFEAGIGLPIVRNALGDSLLLAIGKGPPGPIAPEAKARLLRTLNAWCDAEGGLIENPDIHYDWTSPGALLVERTQVQAGWPLTDQLKSLIADSVVIVHPDGRFLLKENLDPDERNRVSWLHAGILGCVFSNLLRLHEYSYDEQVADHWYVRRL